MARNSRRSSERELFWRRMVEGQKSGGLSVRAWCGQHNLRESAFYWWRRELSRRDVGRTKRVSPPSALRGSGLVPVRIRADGLLTDAFENSAASTSRIEILLPNERRVRITGSIDRQTLTDILAVLTSIPVERPAC